VKQEATEVTREAPVPGPLKRPPVRSRVVVAACPSYTAETVKSALAEALGALGELSTFVRPGQTVLVKPNLFSPHAPEDAVTTHPELVRQVVRACVMAGAGRIWVGDSPVGTNAESALWSRTGMTDAVAETPAVLKSWHVTQRPLPCGSDRLAVPEWYAEVDVVISLPKLKTHALTTMTCALKNVYGMVSGLAKTQFHVKYPSPRTMSAFLVRVFGVLKPHLTIVDAVTAMEGNGPAHGRPLPVGVLLAGCDAVAVDTVGCTALRIPPAAVPMIRMAAACNLGCMDKAGIECVGSGVAALQTAHVRPSFARYLRHVPELAYRLTPFLLRVRPRVLTRACAKCGICAETCPQHVIALNGPDAYPAIDQKHCIGCFCCVESCPHGAMAAGLRFWPWLRVAQPEREKA
jgi:uncharacterized protein (DUF362 family)/Pyruvate/2-oxoacid:ferredoxin oxidoreductase delta subunit